MKFSSQGLQWLFYKSCQTPLRSCRAVYSSGKSLKIVIIAHVHFLNVCRYTVDEQITN